VLAVIKQLAEDGMTMVLVTYEMQFAATSSSSWPMADGRAGPLKTLFANPQSDRLRAFLRRNLEAYMF
jgi:polar amino acid transport system ATP-binding protein